MKHLAVLTLAAALAASSAFGAWVYEGQWGSRGSGQGQFYLPVDVAVAPNGRVYVVEFQNHRVQYFTSSGSYLGMWKVNGYPLGAGVAPNGNVYVVSSADKCVQYFTPSGSFLGGWGAYGRGNGQFDGAWDVAVAPNGDVYVVDTQNDRVQHFTPNGSFLGKWGKLGNAPGEFNLPHGVAVGSNGRVYVADNWNTGVQYFTPNGSYLGRWGEFFMVGALRVAVSRDGVGFAVDPWNNRVRYCTTSGSLIGEWGGLGSGKGQFDGPQGAATSPDSKRVYVADKYNYRVQYFRWSDPAVSPASLGRVKALFR